MKISTALIGILLIGAMIAGFYTFTEDLADSYGITVDTGYRTTYDKTTNISNEINNSYAKIFKTETDDDDNWVVDKTAYLALVPEAVSLVKNIIKLPFTIFTGLIFNFSSDLGLPVWVQSLIFVVALTVLIFGLISLILRYKYT